MTDLFPDLDAIDFTPTRRAGLARLAAFRARMGRPYAERRNHDLGPGNRSNVSALSPWVRSRTLLESELVVAALERHAPSTADKFIQEVCWRTYFKGWLEHRPDVWTQYCDNRDRMLDTVAAGRALGSSYEAAIEGRTGLEGFDDWARELVETGYLHNHARMWFASIWIFTLGLPWELGADFFIHHLMDADPASNTCSWRWVGGLHTPGKTYLARRSNIETYTGGRFAPTGLASAAPALAGSNPDPVPPLRGDPLPKGDIAVLLTEEDLHVETLPPAGTRVTALAGLSLTDARSPGGAGAVARHFHDGVLADALARGRTLWSLDAAPVLGPDAVHDWAGSTGCQTIVTGYPPVGWVRPRLEALRAELAAQAIELRFLQREWDQAFWPHARRGFFGLKKAIPTMLAGLGDLS